MELTQDYLERLRAVQPHDLPGDLDLFDEATATRGIRLNKAAYSLKDEHQRELFRASLRAALTVEEIREMAKSSGLAGCSVGMTSDRHWTIAGQIA